MSLNVLIGSHDLLKINETINILKFVDKTANKNDFNITEETLENLIDWYSSLYNLLSTLGNEEDIELEPA